MPETTAHRAAPSRRDFLGTTGAAIAAAALPSSSAVAQGPKYRRVNVTSPQAGPVLASYKKAIRAMLALPPSDPRNWYRNALTHTLDCPHGNWWFLVWHRGYIGWFEQICRELSGDPQFALPYWDWTQEPRVPAAMYDDVLTPNDPAFIAKATEFKSKFEGPVASYWNGLNNAQIGQLLNRGLRFPADLWFDINDDPRGGMFFEPPIARGLTKEKPGLDIDPDVLRAVSLPTLLNALSPRDFITFGSARTAFHSGLTGSGVLEGQPHNLVHNCVGGAYNTPPTGGFMQANLSPVDPLFFLHHANIDRLWDLWTRKQKAFSLPTLPDGFETPAKPRTDWARWSNEPFLFFVNAQGAAVDKTKAGDYADIGDFGYDYQPGSGEEVVPQVVAAAPAPAAIRRFSANIVNSSVTAAAGTSASGRVTLPADALQGGAAAPKLFAKVTISVPPAAHTDKFRVLVDDGTGAPQDAGVFAMFGHHTFSAPVTFTVPIPTPAASATADARSLNVSVVSAQRATPHGHVAMAPSADVAASAEVNAIVVEAH
jgi:tyrosinase